MSTGDSREPADTEVAFDRSSVHEWATEQFGDLQGLLSELKSMRQLYAEELQNARRERLYKSQSSRLRNMTIQDAVKPGSRIPIQALLDWGIRTAYDLVDLAPERLEQIPGVGETTASRIAELIRSLTRPHVQDLRPDANPSSWSKEDFRLVGNLSLWSWLAMLLGVPHVTPILQLVQALRYLKRWTSWLGWLISPPKRRRRIRSHYATTLAAAQSPRTTSAIGALRNAFERVVQYSESGMPNSQVIQAWRSSSPGLLARLEEFVAEWGTPDERQTLQHGLGLDKLAPDLLRAIETLQLDPQLLAKSLRFYQVVGAKFALAVRRGLLGDDVGLGKTIEAIAAIAHAISVEDQRHHLVISPAQLVDNWLRELKDTMPQVTRRAFREPGRDGAFHRWCKDGGVLVVSYEQASRLAQMDLPDVGFVVADEAHFVKRPDRQRTIATKLLISRGSRALLMGGTLLENRTEELIALAELVDPQKGEDLRLKFGDGSTAHLEPDAFRIALSDIYLRRNQGEVLDELPDLLWTDEPITIDASAHQLSEAARGERNLMKARCVLTTHGGKRSPKMERLEEIVRECREEDRKLLIFSYFREVLALAMELLGDDGAELHGGVRQPVRERSMAAFSQKSGFAALVMQIEVGGVGLNLQSASVVVLMEPQYKPTMEAQAVGRAYRTGQINPVVVHRLVAMDSVDARIVELSGFKAELFDKLARESVLGEALAASSEVNPEDLLREDWYRFDEPSDQD